MYINNAPNQRYDNGPNAAGCGRVSNQVVLQLADPANLPTGLHTDGTQGKSPIRVGFSAAGIPRNNGGPNVAGAPRSFNNT